MYMVVRTGRATRVYNVSKARAYRSLRDGKKAAV
jgi:hypothetical protein